MSAESKAPAGARPVAGFIVSHEHWAWLYRPTLLSAEIVVGMYYEGGRCCDYEFAFEWVADRVRVGGRDFCTLKLHDDGFAALHEPQFAMMWASLAKLGDRVSTPLNIAELLLTCGLVDMTTRTPPTEVQP